MDETSRVRIAIQKSGRLSKPSLELLRRCGLKIENGSSSLLCHCHDFPIDILFVRDDDIPTYVKDGACDLGIVGLNEVNEKVLAISQNSPIEILEKLMFGYCRLALAVPQDSDFYDMTRLQNTRIASSYPNILKRFLDQNNLSASIVTMQGSVEIAPSMGIADAICDLVSTGLTLKSNKLKEIETVIESQAVLIGRSSEKDPIKLSYIDKLLTRLKGVRKAEKAKYIMMNAPKTAVAKIRNLIPGMERPTVVPLWGSENEVAIHAVAQEPVFWETMEQLKSIGASSIIVSPIEKIIE